MSVERITSGELPLLLNLLGEKIEVSFPVYEFSLVEARASSSGYMLKTAGRDLFDDELNRFAGDSSELLGYSDLLTCFLHAGITRYSNEDDFNRQCSAYGALRKGVVFCPDTNLFYQGFMARSGIDPARFAITSTTAAEITASINFKYSPEVIAQLKRSARFGREIFDEFFNAKTIRARRAAYLALRQFTSIRDRAAVLPETTPGTADKEANDLLIVKALRAYEKEKTVLPVMLTADRNLATLCEAEGLEHFLFTVPHEITERSCKPASLASLVFLLAAVAGCVQCGPVRVYGEFRGKGAEADALKVEFLNEKILGPFVRDLGICRKLNVLGIGF